MKKKEKAEFQKMQTAAGLVSLCRDALAKAENKALKKEAENKKRISELTVKEKGLKEKIKTGNEILEKMKIEFSKLERDQAEKNLSELEKNALTKQDVLDGKISIIQFQAQREQAESLKQKAIIQMIEVLKLSADAIREKRTQIIRDEIELYDAQITIGNLLRNPIKFLRHSLVERLDVLDTQLGPLSEAYTSAHNLKIERESDLLLVERHASMSGGKIWRNITLHEARSLACDPTFPEGEVFFLLQQLSEIESNETTRLTITFRQPGSHWPGNPITIQIEE